MNRGKDCSTGLSRLVFGCCWRNIVGNYWGLHLNSNICLKKALLSLTYSCVICEEAKHFNLATLPHKVQEAHSGPEGACKGFEITWYLWLKVSQATISKCISFCICIIAIRAYIYVEWIIGRCGLCKWRRLKYKLRISNHHCHISLYFLFLIGRSRYGFNIVEKKEKFLISWGFVEVIMCPEYTHPGHLRVKVEGVLTEGPMCSAQQRR